MISNCGHDENGRYTGGQPGDQTGTEYRIIPWYDRPWNCVLRHPNPAVQNKIAELATAAPKNDKIGYCQGHRVSFWNALQAANYNPANITTPCEADCSSSTAAIIKAVGYLLGIAALKNVSVDLWTGIMKEALVAAGFEVLTDKKYLKSDAYLLPGDILLNIEHHVAINLTRGSATATVTTTVKAEKTAEKLYGECTVQAHWFLIGATHKEIKAIQILCNAAGIKGKNGRELVVDGELGENTAFAVEQVQRRAGLPNTTNWGTVAGKTWQLLLNLL